MNNKKHSSVSKKIIILITDVFGIVFYSWMQGDEWKIRNILTVTGLGVIAIVSLASVIREIRDGTVPEEEKQFAQKQKRMRSLEQRRMSGQARGRWRNNMYVDVYLKSTAQELFGFVVISLLFLIVIGTKMSALEKALEVAPGKGFVVLAIATALCFAGWLLSTYFVGAVSKLKKEIRRRGYDEEAVKRDYSRGKFFSVNMGVLNIGDTFVIYARRRECCVVSLQSIRSVQSAYFRESYRGIEADRYIVKMYTDTDMVQMSSDDVGMELIIEQFRKCGIPVRGEV